MSSLGPQLPRNPGCAMLGSVLVNLRRPATSAPPTSSHRMAKRAAGAGHEGEGRSPRCNNATGSTDAKDSSGGLTCQQTGYQHTRRRRRHVWGALISSPLQLRRTEHARDAHSAAHALPAVGMLQSPCGHPQRMHALHDCERCALMSRRPRQMPVLRLVLERAAHQRRSAHLMQHTDGFQSPWYVRTAA